MTKKNRKDPTVYEQYSPSPEKDAERSQWAFTIWGPNRHDMHIVGDSEEAAYKYSGRPEEYADTDEVSVLRRSVTYGPWETVTTVVRGDGGEKLLCTNDGWMLLANGTCRHGCEQNQE